MPIIYKNEDVTASIKDGTFDTEAAAAELRAAGGMPVEGFVPDEAMQAATEGLMQAIAEWLRDGPQIPIYEPKSGL